MSQFKNGLEHNSSPNYYYSGVLFNNYNCFALDYIFIVDIMQSIFSIGKVVLITQFDNSKIVKQIFYILEEELPE